MDSLQWWRRTDYAAKATMIGKSATGLPLTLLSAKTYSGEVTKAERSPVTAGSTERAEINVTC